jgi:hypothetical protein
MYASWTEPSFEYLGLMLHGLRAIGGPAAGDAALSGIQGLYSEVVERVRSGKADRMDEPYKKYRSRIKG